MRCVLNRDRICNHCGDCDDRCELNPQKVCDNCFRCLETDGVDYAEIKILDILTDVQSDAFERSPLDWEELDGHRHRCVRARTIPGAKGIYKNQE